MERRVGEVIQSSSVRVVCQSYRLYEAPPLGALVRMGDPPSYGVVCEVRTEPLDPGRPVIARGAEAETEEEVYRENPQLERLLTTRFDALLVAHRTGDGIAYLLPPLPPRVHSFVYACGPGEVREFASSLLFLRTLLTSGLANADDVVASFLRLCAPLQEDPRAFLVSAGKALARELVSDLPRLNSILVRIRQ